MAYRPLWKSLASEARGGKGLVLAIDAGMKAVWDYIDALALSIRHVDTTGQTADDHHNESHTVVSHSDTTATGTELDTLTDGSNADLLHDHTNTSVAVTHASTSGQTTDDHHDQSHAADHVDGTDDIQSATAAQKGVATAAQITKLDGIEALAEVNNISDVNATDLTDGGDTTLHDHDGISENTAARTAVVALGATTLATITARVNGLHVVIATSDSAVVNETGNIILSGATSFEMLTGDTLTLAYDGTNWRETGRSFAS
jgi:hypothetical protein